MIDKKQTVTKQFLLSFKSGHGDFYEKFVNILQGKVHFCRRVKQHEFCPPYMMAQKCIFMSILERKHQKFANQQLDISQLANILQKYRGQILKSISQQKKCILKTMKDFKIQEMQNEIIQLVTRQNFAFNSFQLPQNTYIYELFKAILSRSQQVSYFGQQKYEPMTYSYLQMKQLSAIFNENVIFFDYNQSKSSAISIQFNHQTTYILKVKSRFSILYVKQPKFIQIIEDGTIPLNVVEEIFSNKESKNQQEPEPGFFDIFIGSPSKIKKDQNQTHKLFPDQIQCSKCMNKFSQFDCLKWNYQFLCASCLEKPQNDTSSIPQNLVQKFFFQRGIEYEIYEIKCAQCIGTTFIRNYNPSKKPQKYKCEICEHTICLQHNMNINECFCKCIQCKNLPTINLVSLNISICEFCKKKYCRTCRTISTEFCGCICRFCSQLKEQDHICKQRCHFCRNHCNQMKLCVCSRKICYSCYYYHLKKLNKNSKFTCPNPQC